MIVATAKRAVGAGLRSSGIFRLTQHLARGPVVLFYHGVEDKIADPRVQLTQMPLARFEREMRFLARRYRIISLDQLAQTLAGRRRGDPRELVITVDDGYVNCARLLAPLMASLGLPFVVFVSTRHMAEGGRLASYYLRVCLFAAGLTKLTLPRLGLEFSLADPARQRQTYQALRPVVESKPQSRVEMLVADLKEALPAQQWADLNGAFASEEFMNWEQVEEVARAGGSIGSHGHDHFIMHAAQDPREITEQLAQSRALITARLGECRAISYPRGTPADLCPHAVAQAQAQGYEMAFLAVRGDAGNAISPWLLPRLSTGSGPQVDLNLLHYQLATRWRWQAQYRQACARIMVQP